MWYVALIRNYVDENYNTVSLSCLGCSEIKEKVVEAARFEAEWEMFAITQRGDIAGLKNHYVTVAECERFYPYVCDLQDAEQKGIRVDLKVLFKIT